MSLLGASQVPSWIGAAPVVGMTYHPWIATKFSSFSNREATYRPFGNARQTENRAFGFRVIRESDYSNYMIRKVMYEERSLAAMTSNHL